jgi:hypothetical protein
VLVFENWQRSVPTEWSRDFVPIRDCFRDLRAKAYAFVVHLVVVTADIYKICFAIAQVV